MTLILLSSLIGALCGVLGYFALRSLWLSMPVAFIGALVTYVSMPVMNPAYLDGYGFAIFTTLIVGGSGFMLYMGRIDVNGRHNLSRSDNIGGYVSLGVIGVGISLTLCTVLSSWGLFRAGSYRELLGEVTTSNFSLDTAPIDLSQARTVDQDLARKLAETKLGEWKGGILGSTTEVGVMNIQKVNGRLYWVGPLNHSGFFRYLLDDAPPAYVKVSATNANEVELVTEVKGQKIALRYNMGAYFGDYPQRRLYGDGFATVGLTDFTFEVDDDGRPYWVVTLYEPKVGLLGDDAIGVVTLDAQTGDAKRYGIADVPAWIDRVQPEELVATQISDWGYFRGGSLNGWFNPSNKGRFALTDRELTLVYGHDGQSYWYNGITSVGRDNSTVGFMLINTRTKAAKRYDVAGATETRAQQSAQGTVQEKGYQATTPVLYNVQGRPTYFTTLKDANGFVKLVAFVSVENFQDGVGIASDVNGAYRKYVASMARIARGNAVDSTIDIKSLTGAITRRQAVVREGSTEFWFIIDSENMIFVVTPDVSREAPMTMVGDTVKVNYRDGGNSQVTVMSFDNVGLVFQETPETARNDQAAQRAAELSDTKLQEVADDAAWEKLSPADKQRILEQRIEAGDIGSSPR